MAMSIQVSVFLLVLVQYFATMTSASQCNDMDKFLSVQDFEEAAVQRLPLNLRDYLQKGAGRDSTLARNYEYLEKVRVIPRYLRDISNLTSSTIALDRTLDMPVGIAPSGLHKRWHPLGELATVRAAASRNTIYIVSSATSIEMEELRLEEPESEMWLQMFLMNDKTVQNDLIRRAEEAGLNAIVLTIDMPVSSLRYHNKRNQHKDQYAYANTERYKKNGTISYTRDLTTWEEVAEVASRVNIPIIIKGVLSVEDALKAREHGARGIIVSNHGGRQIDGAISSIEALAAISEALTGSNDGNFDVYYDGGIMTGLDVYRAIALGAKFVFAGRAPMYGLTVGGQEGIERVLDILDDEFRIVMAQAGFQNVESISRDSVRTFF